MYGSENVILFCKPWLDFCLNAHQWWAQIQCICRRVLELLSSLFVKVVFGFLVGGLELLGVVGEFTHNPGTIHLDPCYLSARLTYLSLPQFPHLSRSPLQEKHFHLEKKPRKKPGDPFLRFLSCHRMCSLLNVSSSTWTFVSAGTHLGPLPFQSFGHIENPVSPGDSW